VYKKTSGIRRRPTAAWREQFIHGNKGAKGQRKTALSKKRKKGTQDSKPCTLSEEKHQQGWQ